MPHDANGELLQVGDQVYIPCHIKSVRPGEYCTTDVEFDIPMPPYTTKSTYSALNAIQVVKDPTNISYRINLLKEKLVVPE